MLNISSKVVEMLLLKGSDVNVKCKWTDMAALHYAVFFDIEAVVDILIEATNDQGLLLSK